MKIASMILFCICMTAGCGAVLWGQWDHASVFFALAAINRLNAMDFS